MAVDIIKLWAARDFDFSTLGASAEVTFDPCPVVDLLPYRDALFLLCVHDVTITGAASLDFAVLPAAPSSEEPAGTFVDTQTSLSLSVAGASSGELLRGLISLSTFGACVQVRGTASQAVGAVETIQARVSAALVGRR